MKKIIFLVLILVLSGCSVSRKTAVKEDVKVDVIEAINETINETAAQTTSTDVVKEVTTSITDKTVIRTIETVYSKPDSSGTQHKKSEKVTETLNDITVKNEENERIISEQKNEIERLTSVNSALQTKLEAYKQVTAKTSAGPPIWSLVVTFISGVIALLLLRPWQRGIFKR